MEEKRTKSTALLVLGVIAVIAVIGLVMLFVQNNEATGAYYACPKIYGGAVKMDPYPDYTGRGVPAEIYSDGLRTAILPTQEISYQGMLPPSPTLGWQGQGPRSPAQTATYQWGAGSQRLSSLSWQEYKWLNNLYVTKRIGDQEVRLKRYRCGQDPIAKTYWCDSLLPSTA